MKAKNKQQALPLKQGKRSSRPKSERPKDFKATLKKLFIYSKKFALPIGIATFASVAGTVLQVIGPTFMSKVVGEIEKGLEIVVDGGLEVLQSVDIGALYSISLSLALIYGASLIFSYAQGLIMASVTQRLSKSIRTDISHKINRLPLKYFDSTSIGDVLSRVTNDVDAIGTTLNQSLGTLVTSLTLLIGSLLMMFYSSTTLALTAILASFVGFGFMLLTVRFSQRYFKEQQENLGLLNGHIEEYYTGHNIVKAYNAGRKSKETFDEINDNLYTGAWKSQFLSGLMMPVMLFVGNIGYVAVSVVGAALTLKGHISFGTILAFVIFVRLFSQSLSQIAQVINNLQRTAAASERVFNFLEEEELEDESEKISRANLLHKVKGDIDFQNVNFSYVEGKPVIKNFSARIKAGQKVAIVGPTGAGKTTIVNLIMRFYNLDSGHILIDEIPIDSLPRESIHALFGMVLQDTWLFEGSIRENIVYNMEGVSDLEVEDACKSLGIHHFIRTLPKGYDSVLNEKTGLSEGQKQLLTIARAMIQNAPMLILDEATSSVDTRTERIVQRAMESLTRGRTSFIIAHRLSTIVNADVILVMKDGDIIESGNHEDLLAADGFYADLYRSQFA